MLSATSPTGSGSALRPAPKRQIHGERPEFAHHLRRDVSGAGEFMGQIFELGAHLAQRGPRHHHVGFSDWRQLRPAASGSRASASGPGIRGRHVLGSLA